MEYPDPVVTVPDEELALLVARVLYKAKYPLRRWRQTKEYKRMEFVRRARSAIERLRREDERLGPER